MTSNLSPITATIASVFLVASGSEGLAAESINASRKIRVTRSGSQLSRNAPAEHFTGSVRIDSLFQTEGQSNTSAAYVTFEPGAHSAWHTHPLGQILIVTAGTGGVQRWGDPVEEIGPGDVVWIPPDQKHWHGASPTTAMTHIAIQEAVAGKNVEWMEKVTEEQYNMTTTTKTIAQSDTPSSVSAQTNQPDIEGRSRSPDDVRRVAPALE